MLVALVAFLALFVLAFLRIPLAFSMGIVGFAGVALTRSPHAAAASVSQTVFETGALYTLSVIPLFVLMGGLVTRSGLSRELYAAAHAFLGHRRGGLAISTIVAAGGFGAICGSSLATTATMTKVALPEMERRGYDPSLATGAIAAGGTLGILIPPSVIMILYGIMTETSIAALFAAGLLPGLIAIAFYIAAIRWTVWRHPDFAPPAERVGWRDRIEALRQVWRVLVLFGIVLGGIYGGVFTPTEAAGIGAFGALVITLLRGGIGFRDYVAIFVEAARTSAMIFAVLIGAMIFANFINFTSMSSDLGTLILGYGVQPLLVMLVMTLLYVVLGCVLESISMIVLTVPIFYPIIAAMGLDLVWFGIIVVVVTEISLITPPVGMNVFVLRALTPHIRTSTIFKGLMPFIAVDFARIALLILVPGITLFLPQLLGLIG